jgi:hypothetical protein
MARKSQRIRREHRVSRLQQKLAETNQLKVENSIMIEKIEEAKEEGNLFDTVLDSVVEISSMEILQEVEDKLSELVEVLIEEKPEIPSSGQLKKMKKVELLSLAEQLEIEDITSRNTKKQIIEAIEAGS